MQCFGRLRLPGVQKSHPCGLILDRELARGSARTLETSFLIPVCEQGLLPVLSVHGVLLPVRDPPA